MMADWLGRLGNLLAGGRGGNPIHPVASDTAYQAKLPREVEFFKSYENVHDLPGICHYWSNKYLFPQYRQFGIGNPKEFFSSYMQRACTDPGGLTCRFVSVGAGNCDVEAERVQGLLQAGVNNFVLECLDVNEAMPNRGRALSRERGVERNMSFCSSDINSWRPKERIIL
jgi:hypothetical protein